MTEPEQDVGPVLAALADPTRRQLLDVLAGEGEASATALASRLPISRQAVVKHLAVLQDAGLVAGVRAGREVRFRVRSDRLDESGRWISALASRWDRRLASVKRAAEETNGPEAPRLAARAEPSPPQAETAPAEPPRPAAAAAKPWAVWMEDRGER